MDTITIESVQVGVPSVSYTSAEVIRFIQKAKDYDELCTNLSKAYDTSRNIREKVRDFFSEGEWDDDTFTASKEDINELLESIGSFKLTTKYSGSFTITGTFSDVEAEDEDDARDKVQDNMSVDCDYGNIRVDEVEVTDIDENY